MAVTMAVTRVSVWGGWRLRAAGGSRPDVESADAADGASSLSKNSPAMRAAVSAPWPKERVSPWAMRTRPVFSTEARMAQRPLPNPDRVFERGE